MARDKKRRKQRRECADEYESDNDSVVEYETTDEFTASEIDQDERRRGMSCFRRRLCVKCRQSVQRVLKRPLFFAKLTMELALSVLFLVYVSWNWCKTHCPEPPSLGLNGSSFISLISQL
jgi:hypothetical protein